MNDYDLEKATIAARIQNADDLKDRTPGEILSELFIVEPSFRLELSEDNLWLLMDRMECVASGSMQECARAALNYHVKPGEVPR